MADNVLAAIDSQLLEDIKLSLDITWTDKNTDASVANYIADGMAYINDKLGEPGDYSVPGYSRTLLFDYVRYARDKALDVFENNYLALLLAMQNNRRVSAFELESTEKARQ